MDPVGDLDVKSLIKVIRAETSQLIELQSDRNLQLF